MTTGSTLTEAEQFAAWQREREAALLNDARATVERIDLAGARRALGKAGFRTTVLEQGTLCAYKGTAALGFGPRRGSYSAQAVLRAIQDDQRHGGNA